MPISPLFMQPKAVQPQPEEENTSLCAEQSERSGVVCIDFFSGASSTTWRDEKTTSDGVAFVDFFGTGGRTSSAKPKSRQPSTEGTAVVDFFGGSQPIPQPPAKSPETPPTDADVTAKKEETPVPDRIEPMRELDAEDARSAAIRSDVNLEMALQRVATKYNVEGKVVLILTVSPKGKITAVEVDENTTGDDAFEDAFIKVFQGRKIHRYRAAEEETLRITYKFQAE
jgi:hypothetical protein